MAVVADTAGWYLNFLYSCGVHFKGSDPILKVYAQAQAKGKALMGEASASLPL